jgi:hypothetical protein
MVTDYCTIQKVLILCLSMYLKVVMVSNGMRLEKKLN